MKKMAGINTAITGVGTGLGAGATIVGIIKNKKDELRKDLNRKLLDLKNMSDKEFLKFLGDISLYKEYTETLEKLEQANKQSKNLGNWRTGLLAGNTATNVAGAIIAGRNTTDGDLQNQIDNCKAAISELRRVRAKARIDGVDVSEANAIISACEGFETVDISKINARAKGAMVSSIVGATTGLAGTITSGVANSESVRKDNIDVSQKTDADWNKEKNLNTTANILAGTSTVASATATVFNATQISAIKKVATVAEKCTEVLK
ncbi:MAG: hypothetical protein II179_02215 [Alphaproteobacteria bacterium]|nr:hypothetical protein [Alphaproteobacteria bacterium]